VIGLLIGAIFFEDLMIKPVDFTCSRCGKEEEKWTNTNEPFSFPCCDRLMEPNKVQLMGYRTDHTIHGELQ